MTCAAGTTSSTTRSAGLDLPLATRSTRRATSRVGRRFKRPPCPYARHRPQTELAAAVGFAELHPEAPVRCDGFDAYGQPVGMPVTDPYIPMVDTEEQTEELRTARCT
ncbi:hypothetical protein ACU686_44795 [Yinghuangia aomiensis]